MSEGISWFLYIISEFFLYLLAYKVILDAKIEKSFIRWGVCIGGVTVVLVCAVIIAGFSVCEWLTMFVMVSIPLFLLNKDRRIQYLIMYPFIVMASSLVGVAMSYIFAFMMKTGEYYIIEDRRVAVGCQAISIVALLLLWLFRMRRKKCYEIRLEWKQFFLFYIVLLCLLCIVAPIQILAKHFPNDILITQVGIASSISAIMLVAVTIWQGILVNRELIQEREHDEQEQYIINQKQYYEDLLAQDEKMRRFRHDMNAHFQVLQSYCSDGANEKMKSYLQKIVISSAIYDKKIITGNTAIDAVLTPLFEMAAKAKIEISADCLLPEKLEADKEFQICTVISNLFRNAIEACIQIEDPTQRMMQARIGMYNSQVVIMISNTIKNEVIIQGKKLVTTKKDSRYHGLGSGNVEHIVQSCNGMIQYRCENGWFFVDVVMQLE